MQGYNCVMVYNQTGDKLVFCRRKSDPYKGKYNLVGGKIEPGEDGFQAAYRELEEETGITASDLVLYHMMDFTYYNQDCYMEVYSGTLLREVGLKEEKHPLEWLVVSEEDFFSEIRFAGEGNIGHMVQQVVQYGMGQAEELAGSC